jgi:hypothetical protein
MVYFKNTKGEEITAGQWIADLRPEERELVRNALQRHMTDEPVSYERFKKDFSALSNDDRKSFIKMIHEADAFVKAGMAADELDAALQAELDKRNQIATNAAWDKTVADAKARAAAARAEV